MILTRDGKEITAVYRQDGSEVDEVKDANGRLIYTASREITGTLPLSFSGRGKPLTDYLISGNTVQDGTPTPEAPVDVVGCGVWDETRQSYKLPPTVNGTEYQIYLGFTESTRRIRKLVLTGEEQWNGYSSAESGVGVSLLLSDMLPNSRINGFCTHFTPQLSPSRSAIDGITFGASNASLYITFSVETVTALNLTDTASVKAWLASQYAAGTPVTVWYVLANEQTGIINEPLMKIGDYADTVSMAQAGVTIPTVSGENVLDMTSPVKPSEVYIKGKGIRPTGYGQLVDKNGVRILDKNGNTILVHGQ